MITKEHLQTLLSRRDQLHKFLNISNKKTDADALEKKTQSIDFWEDLFQLRTREPRFFPLRRQYRDPVAALKCDTSILRDCPKGFHPHHVFRRVQRLSMI